MRRVGSSGSQAIKLFAMTARPRNGDDPDLLDVDLPAHRSERASLSSCSDAGFAIESDGGMRKLPKTNFSNFHLPAESGLSG
jgi:hypothetical protein